MTSRALSVPAEHPCLAGHFPGQPIVPGVVLLEHLLREAADELALTWPITLTHSKFLAPVLPDQTLLMSVECKDDKRARLTLHRGQTPVLEVMVRW